MKTMIAFWNILKKDIQTYYLKPPNISWGIIFPLSWTLMQMIRAPEMGILELLPGLIAMSVLFGTTSMLAVTITFERSSHSFDRLLLAPISLATMVVAKITGAIVFGLFNALVPLIIAAFYIDLSGVKWGLMAAGIFLIAITSTLMGLFIAVSATQIFEAQTFSNFFRFPMLFLCGLFVPLSSLPAFIRPLSFLLPLTYGTEMLKGAISKSNFIAPGLCAGILVLFALGLFSACHYNINRKWIL